MKGRKLIIGALLLGMTTTFVGCSSQDSIDNKFYTYEKKYYDNYGNIYNLVVDKDTNILYIRCSGTLTPYLDADGKPIKDTYDWKNKRTLNESKEK